MASPTNKRALLGILLVIVGTLFLLDNLGFDIDLPYWVFSWPAIFVALGFINLISGNMRPALLFLALSGVFYLQYFDIINLREFWPVILIIIGISIMLSRRAKAKGFTESSDTYFDEVAIFGSVEKKYVSGSLQGGKVTSLFGGCAIDLRGAKAQDGAVIEIFCMFGGVELLLPDDWKVNMNATAIFGGFSDSRKNISQAHTASVLIKGFTMFGGGEIKN